jgi:hypothetical protein
LPKCDANIAVGIIIPNYRNEKNEKTIENKQNCLDEAMRPKSPSPKGV